MKLSAVRKVLETLLFLALGIIETLGSIISHGTSLKFADVRLHLRKVSKMTLSSILLELEALFCFYSKNSEYYRKFLTLLFPYAKILNKTLNKGESQT